MVAVVIGAMSGNGPQGLTTTHRGGSAMLTRALAIKLAHQRMHANTLAPGDIRIPFTSGLLSNENSRAWPLEPIPAPFGESDDVVASAFLAPGDASYVAGSVLTVDGVRLAQ